MKQKKVLAICLKTYPDENDLQKFRDGEITDISEIRFYEKGNLYFVYEKTYNKEFYKLI
jgi:hypothetical protein